MRGLQENFTILGICMCSTEMLDSLPQTPNFTETGLHRWHFPKGGFREGVQGECALSRPLFFFELRTSKTYKNKQHK